MRWLVLVAPVAVLMSCTPMPKRPTPPRDRGPRTDSSWCDPSRGLPADPALGLEEPLRFGVASIVHADDSTSESFVAHRALQRALQVPEHRVAVSLVDHPSDADYSITGVVSGTPRYARQGDTGLAPFLLAKMGYLIGGSIAATGIIINAASDQDASIVLGIGMLVVGGGLAADIYMATRPANHYSWNIAANLTLRWGSIVIGEIAVRDIYDEVHWKPLESPRADSTQALWAQAAREIAACVAADLAGPPAEPIAEGAP